MSVIDLTKGERNSIHSIENCCPVCKQTNVILVNGDRDNRWMKGEYVQVAFNNLNSDERELLISGTHAECWEKLFNEA